MGATVYICKRCGMPTENYYSYSPYLAGLAGAEGISICDACTTELNNIREWENEQFETRNLVCPWCGYEDRDSWELSDSDDSYTCPECGEVFAYERNITVTYTSRKRELDYPRGGVMPDA